MIAYTREHLVILQQVLGSIFGIGARVRHPKAKSEQDKAARKPPPHHIIVCHPLQASVEKTSTDVTSKVSIAPVTHGIRIKTLMVLPTEATLRRNNQKGKCRLTVRQQRPGGCGTAVRLGVAPPGSTCWLQHTDFL
jgi:hypothetical protein